MTNMTRNENPSAVDRAGAIAMNLQKSLQPEENQEVTRQHPRADRKRGERARLIRAFVLALGVLAGVRAQVPDFTPKTPLLGALLHNDAAEAKRLLAEGADPNQGRFVGIAPVFLAVIRQDRELLRAMAASKVDLAQRDPAGNTALMWAAFNEAGDAKMVEELLVLGADPNAVNKAGETALTWALRRGQTPAVAALHKAGASDIAAIRASAQKAIALLQKSGSQFIRVSGCVSCHHQSLPQMAFGLGRTRELTIDEQAARQQVDAVTAMFKPLEEAMVKNRDRIPNPPISLSYALLGLAAENYSGDRLTAAMAQAIGAWQSADGAFYPLPAIRPPLESSAFTATALSLRALQLFGQDSEEQVTRARNWLLMAQAQSTEDRAMRLLGLAWGKTTTDDVRNAARVLLAEQRTDGGWAQLPTLETDAYATGQALVALGWSGAVPITSLEYQRGLQYLVRTQFDDGSWLVRTRTFPVQPPKESGFPHGKHQWISAAGTSWAAMALTLSLPGAQKLPEAGAP
jgi:hypothetical protein